MLVRVRGEVFTPAGTRAREIGVAGGRDERAIFRGRMIAFGFLEPSPPPPPCLELLRDERA